MRWVPPHHFYLRGKTFKGLWLPLLLDQLLKPSALSCSPAEAARSPGASSHPALSVPEATAVSAQAAPLCSGYREEPLLGQFYC